MFRSSDILRFEWDYQGDNGIIIVINVVFDVDFDVCLKTEIFFRYDKQFVE